MGLVRVDRSNRFYSFSSKNKPAARARSGDVVIFEVNDCFDGQIQFKEGILPSVEIDKSRVNPATGPLWIEGARAGMMLAVHVMDIDVPKLGLIRKWVLPIRKGVVSFANVRIPIRPMIGVIGVAPKSGSIPNSYPGDHGGNLDSPDVTVGSIVFLPVWIDGALLGIGDVHAIQGDGEVSGQGLEIPAIVTVKISLFPRQIIPKVIIETTNYIAIVASAKTIDDACNDAIKHAVELLRVLKHLNKDEALTLLSMTSDLRISQLVNPLKTVRLCIPKYVVGSLIHHLLNENG